MSNIIQSTIQNFMTWVYSANTSDAIEADMQARQKEYAELLNYYKGKQKLPLAIRNGKNYNVIAGLCGLVVDRSVHMLMGADVTFELPGKNTPADEYLADAWTANKKAKKLLDLSEFGAIYGTEFIKIIPDGVEHNGQTYPRLVILNPYNVAIITAQDDIDNIRAYVIRWNDGDTLWREITENRGGSWAIRTEKANNESRGKWVQSGPEVLWGYPFAPIAHEKNLPAAGCVYGKSDIEQVLDLQDHYNASNSDIRAILNSFAFPLRYVSGGKLPRVTLPDGSQVVDIGPEKILEFQNAETKMGMAEMQSDLASSRDFSKDIRSDLFSISNTVDPDTIRENASRLTNFGLKVMYQEEIAKNATKQLLYGDLLSEVNRRMLIMAGKGEDGGTTKFGNPLPENDMEDIQVIEKEINLGLVDKQTASEKRGYDWEKVQKRLKEQKSQSDALGGNLLRDFMAGRNQIPPQQQPQMPQMQPAALQRAQMMKQNGSNNAPA